MSLKSIPSRFRIRLRGDRVAAFEKGVERDWKVSSSTVGAESIQWASSGTISPGESNLGAFRLASLTNQSVSVLLEFLADDASVICVDSSVIRDSRPYYALSRNVPMEFVDVPSPNLNLQFYNAYAASDSAVTLMYDVDTREPIASPVRASHFNLIHGDNRISVPLGEYALVEGKRYMLVISDHKDIYRFNFRLTNDRKK